MSTPTVDSESQDITVPTEADALPGTQDIDSGAHQGDFTESKAATHAGDAAKVEAIRAGVQYIQDNMQSFKELGCLESDYKDLKDQLMAMRDLETTIDLGLGDLTTFTAKTASITNLFKTLTSQIDVKGTVSLGNAYDNVQAMVEHVKAMSDAVKDFKLKVTATASSSYPEDLAEVSSLFKQTEAEAKEIISHLNHFVTCDQAGEAGYDMSVTRKQELENLVDALKQVQTVVDNADDITDAHVAKMESSQTYFTGDGSIALDSINAELQNWANDFGDRWGNAPASVDTEQAIDDAGATDPANPIADS